MRTAGQMGTDNDWKIIECARAIVRGVYQALPQERAAYVRSSCFEPAVAEVISHLRKNQDGRSLARKYLTRTIALVVLAKILPDGGTNVRESTSTDLTPAIFDAVAQRIPAGLERRQTQICTGCVGGFQVGPKHREECHRYTTQEDVPSYVGTRRPGESSLDFGIRVHKALEEAQTEPPPAPVVAEPECPCCRSEKISYNARADVWHCSFCSWSKRQLVEPPPGPKFKVGDWVATGTDFPGPLNGFPSQVMGFHWSSEWRYQLRREFLGGFSAVDAPESKLSLDPHRQAAAKMFGKPAAHVTPEERQAAKLKAFKDAYTVIPGADFYQVRPEDRVRMIGKPPSWGTAW